jgi:hypothetical protein
MATDIKANATRRLHNLGQSLWLDNITRGLLTSGTLRKYIQVSVSREQQKLSRCAFLSSKVGFVRLR